MLVLRVFHWFEWNHFLSVKSWGIQDGYGSLTLELWHSKNPCWGLYIFYTRSQGVAALVSASAAETRTLSTTGGHPAWVREGETKEPTSGQSHPVMSSAQNFMKITPASSALDVEKVSFTCIEIPSRDGSFRCKIRHKNRTYHVKALKKTIYYNQNHPVGSL